MKEWAGLREGDERVGLRGGRRVGVAKEEKGVAEGERMKERAGLREEE